MNFSFKKMSKLNAQHIYNVFDPFVSELKSFFSQVTFSHYFEGKNIQFCIGTYQAYLSYEFFAHWINTVLMIVLESWFKCYWLKFLDLKKNQDSFCLNSKSQFLISCFKKKYWFIFKMVIWNYWLFEILKCKIKFVMDLL